MPRSDCADAQVDLGFRCSYMPRYTFSIYHNTVSEMRGAKKIEVKCIRGILKFIVEKQ